MGCVVKESEHSEDVSINENVLWCGVYDAGSTAVVLECVFSRLPAQELWRCGQVCRAWRHAAAGPGLWRRLLLPSATPSALRALAVSNDIIDSKSEWSWRKEYVLENARWENCERLLTAGASSVPLLCAALHSGGSFLALVDDDARLTIYEHIRPKAAQPRESEWIVQWSNVVKTEWRSISSVQWSPAATNLLLAGRLALVDRFELLCINFDDEWHSKTVCRSASGPGGSGCWVDDHNFLSMRLQLLAPGHACTTVWLNAASQETYSEFAGVTAPLLRIYNESATHISHMLVADVPEEEEGFDNNGLNTSINSDCWMPNESYYSKLKGHNLRKTSTEQMLIAAGGVAGGMCGEARALVAWRLPAPRVPVLWVEDILAQRVQRHRLRLDAAPTPDREPDLDIMRALCAPPRASCSLSARILGIVLHPRGGCVWATTNTGACCVSVPHLTPLLQLPRVGDSDPLLLPHYVLPSVNDDFFVTPSGGGSGAVRLWTARGGRQAARLQHGGPALAAFLLPRRARRRRMLVLTSDNLHALVPIVKPRYITKIIDSQTEELLINMNKSSYKANIPRMQYKHDCILCKGRSCIQMRRLSTDSGGPAVTNTSSSISKETLNANKLSTMLNERAQYKEAAQGRISTIKSKLSKNKSLGGGGLELKVPPSADTVRVRVLLDFNASPPLNIKMKPILDEGQSQYRRLPLSTPIPAYQ